MSWRRGKTSGRAAFDLEQRRKLGLEPEAKTESFPSVSSSISKNSENVALREKPFTSELQQSVNFSILSYDTNLCKKQLPVSSSSTSTRTSELVTEYNNERSASKALEMLKEITIEPEWEEEDVYLVHRKDALRMMRSAALHSKAAKDAYSRGYPLAAQQYSQKAREEWMVAKRLNEKAAKEILTIRNSKNDLWTFDLHGLHVAEAVTALQEHLRKIESQVPINWLVSANGVKSKSSITASALSVSANYGDIEKRGMQTASSRSGPKLLQVITGRGNHSRGEAALPAAIRSFLIKNGYCFDQTRPGVINVHPKFRRQ